MQHLTLSKLTVDLFVNGMWQKAGHTGGPAPGLPDTLNAYGVGYGVRLGILGVQLGFAGGYDRGGGMYIPLGDVSIDTAGHLRDVFTYWGSADLQHRASSMWRPEPEPPSRTPPRPTTWTRRAA